MLKGSTLLQIRQDWFKTMNQLVNYYANIMIYTHQTYCQKMDSTRG